MKTKTDESIKRVSIQIMAYPYLKDQLKELAKQENRSPSSMGEIILTEEVGRRMRLNGKPAKKARNGK